MNHLHRLRDGWHEVEAEETRLLQQLTVQESVTQYLALQREFRQFEMALDDSTLVQTYRRLRNLSST